MATKKKKAPTTRLTLEMLETFRTQLRASLGKTRKYKYELKRLAEELKHEKHTQAHLHSMVSGLEAILEDRKSAVLAEAILGKGNS